MAKCVISTGRGEACKDSLGGISAVYFFNYGEAVFTINADGWVTDIQPAAGASVNAYKYTTRHQSNLEQNINAAPENGTVYFEQVVNLVLKRLDAQTSKEVKLLAWGRPQIVVETNTGQSWLVGYANGADVTGGTISTGTAKGDLSGYTINFMAEEKAPAQELKGSVIGAPFGSYPNVNVVMGVEGGVAGVGAITAVADAGTVTVGDPLDSTNTLAVTINMTGATAVAGAYSLTTDKIQGISYSGSGSINSVGGTETVTLQGYGTPTGAAGNVTYTVTATVGTFPPATANNNQVAVTIAV